MFVIIGASGYLGSYLIKNILNDTNDKIIATYNSLSQDNHILSDRVDWVKLDISHSTNVDHFCNTELQDGIKYKFIYLAAYHHPDKVEENIRIAWDINTASLDRFLYKAKPKIHSLYYASTDSVYGESVENHIFVENDLYNPVNTYGRTKAIAEQIVLMHGFSVIRYSLLMGPSLITKKHFFDIIAESLKHKEEIDMLADSFRSVITFDAAAHCTISLLENYYKKQDIINISGDEHLSKFEVAIRIANKLSLDRRYIKSILTANQTIFSSSKRAQNTLISNQKLKNILKIDDIGFLV